MKVLNQIAKLTNIKLLILVLSLLGSQLAMVPEVYAQLDTITLPEEIEIDGVEEDSNIIEIIIAVVRVLAVIVIWIIVIAVGISFMKNILASVNKVMNSRGQDGGTKWGDVVGDILGNAFILIIIFAFAIYLQGFLIE